MLKKQLFLSLILAAPLLPGCAFFNTFYHARKSYNNAINIIEHSKEQVQPQISSSDISADRFSQEQKTVSTEAKQFLDVAIEKANKVVVLYPKSRWAEDATLLLGKAHYLRDYSNDLYDAKNRFEVFLARYPESKKIPEARVWYGKTLLKLNQVDDAETNIRLVSESVEISKYKTEALLLLGDIAVNEGDYASACEYYAKASSIAGEKSNKKSAFYKSFYAYFHVGNFKLAIGYLNVLTSMDLEPSEQFDAFFMKARAMKMAGQYNEAIRSLNSLLGNLRYKNYFVKAEFEIADVLRLAGKNKEAIQQFNYVIDTYNNPLFNGECYYFLGLIYDTPIVSEAETFVPDHELAKKYYYLVKTKYSNSINFLNASNRFDYLTKMDLFRRTIQYDELFLGVIDNKIKDSTLDINIEEYFPSNDTAAVTSDGETISTTSKPGVNSKTEIASIKLTNEELEEKSQQIQAELLDIGGIANSDTLIFRKNVVMDMLAADYIRLADYFYFNLSNYDSAGRYYQFVIDHFTNSPMLEFALYENARIQQKRNDPNYKSFYERAYHAFPTGRLADIGKKVLNLEENESDSIQVYLEQAESHLLKEQDYEEALQCYVNVALRDSAERKLQALYAMGLIYEKRMDMAAKAFRSYTTLVFAGPNSDYAKKVRPKVDAYAKENSISPDSLVYWVDSNFFKVTRSKTRPDSIVLKSPSKMTTSKDSLRDSTHSRLPQGFESFENTIVPLDTTVIDDNKKKRRNKSEIKLHDAIKDEDIDAIKK